MMLRTTAVRRFFGGFSSGFSKGFSGGASKGNTGGGGSFFTSSKGGNFGGFPGFGGGGGGGGFPGPLGGLIDQALEWCSTSHAQDIARQEGIDLRNIRFEKTPEGGMNVMVDAPGATPLQIEQLGKRVQEECPVARFRSTQVQSPQQQMKWMRLPDNNNR